jgi:tetratricopeptide (TPR) repeat protein
VLGKAGALCTRSEVARAGLERASTALHTLRQARSLKAEGNAAYGAGQYERAITLYSEALRVDIEGALEPALLGNRSQAYAKVRSFSLALADCERARDRLRRHEAAAAPGLIQGRARRPKWGCGRVRGHPGARSWECSGGGGTRACQGG